jgi:glucose/arabinose dehydrogenase
MSTYLTAMNKLSIILLIFGYSLNLIAQPQLPDGFITQQIANNLDPTTFVIAPDGRIFITIKSGQIVIVENNELLPQPFLSIAVDNFNERGLSGITLDPEFESNNYVYVFYTIPNANRNRISRFTANGNFAIPGSEQILLELNEMPGDIHNAGAMKFGKDGKLYVSTGDGAHAPNSQSMNNLLGKVLRINKDGSIPDDNPFYATANGNNRAIYALGFRNPFSMDIHPHTGEIVVGDVGGSAWEEINIVVAGGNYGWPIIEGKRTTQSPPANYQDPLYAYNHSQGCAITAVGFYHPEEMNFPEEYMHKIFFADYCQGYIKVYDVEHDQVENFATGINRPINLKTAVNGAMYYLERAGMGGGSQQDNTSTTNGSLWKIQYTGTGEPFITVQPQNQKLVIGETARFQVNVLGQVPFQFQWQVDEVDIDGANQNIYELVNVALSDNGKHFRCVITNELGEAISQTAFLEVADNTRPVPLIIFPEEGTTYRAGEVLNFEGSASDAEDGELPASALTWKIDFHHDDHYHPALASIGNISSSSYEIPRIGEISDNVWYRIHLTATDFDGYSSTVYRDVLPVKTNVTIETEPPGILMNVDGQVLQTPASFTSVVGITRTFEAYSTFQKDGKLYVFDKWDNGAQSNILSYNAEEGNPTLKALYKELPVGSGSGLVGFYHSDQNRTFDRPVTLTRIDEEINFDWGGGSPHESISANFFTVRWLGEITALFSGYHTFHVTSDDGIRLWVNDFLLIDKWVPQGATEWTGVINFQQGKKYPIRLDYFEEAGAASVKLEWSSAKLSRQIVPKSQLHPDIILAIQPSPSEINYDLYPSIVDNVLNIRLHEFDESSFLWRIYNNLGQEILSGESNQAQFELDLQGIKPGMYLFRTSTRIIKFYKR